ncbi:unnamed protein product [Triticum turgidum subsp. durum]|uniref:Cysteine-rich receptor-like protein kinase n=1 Tax=Triticum turgidum subsp. durum TaxID=4567 RepID=A0A9R0XR60_TRITD|nr:unnamed protein product [Triticum turgidum subsp. durum]
MAKPHHHRRLASVTTTTLLLLAVLHIVRTAAEDEQPPWPICGPEPSSGNYPQNSTYDTNINLLSASLPRNASSSAAFYATGNVGDVPNIVYGQALCRGDVANASACESCVATAFGGAQQACPLYKDVVIFYDLCQLRFSNRNFLLDDDYIVTTYWLQRSRLVGSPAFDGAVGMLVNATADHAVGDSSRRFGTGEVGFNDRRNPKIYALSQCAPDITPEVCRNCLNAIIGQLPKWFSRMTGGGIFGVWCNFRYEVYSFFSGRPLVELPQIVERPPASAPPVIPGGEKRRNSTGKVVAILMPTIAVMLVIAVVYLFCWRRRRPEEDAFLPSQSATSNDIQPIDSLLLDLATLRVATDDFDNSKMLGKGGFGIVYKGVLPDGEEIAVKRLCQTSRQGIGELKSELVLVAKLHHRNLVRLVGVCLEEQEKILVYEYMPKRSLDTILFDYEQNKELDWGKRFKIINGIARGLQYLHQDSQLKIVHRDLKASNILLDFDYNPKISDFGLAKLFGGDQSEDVTSRIAGTYGYMAPEYAMRGQYSIKSDVFSFGVLVLEVVTGRRNDASHNIEQDVDLVNLVWEHWNRGNVIELIDPSLCNHPPVDQILKCIHVGLLCVQRKPASRPTMSSVNIMFSSHTVRLPSLSRPPFFIQDISVSESWTAHSDAYPPGENSTVMSSNQVSITELSPR